MVVMAMAVGPSVVGCGPLRNRDPTGCDQPESRGPLHVGESVDVTVKVEDKNAPHMLDVGGHFWKIRNSNANPRNVRTWESPLPVGTFDGSASRTDSDHLLVNLGEAGSSVWLITRVTCE